MVEISAYGVSLSELKERKQFLAEFRNCSCKDAEFRCNDCQRGIGCPVLRNAAFKQGEKGEPRLCVLHGDCACVVTSSVGTSRCRDQKNWMGCRYRLWFLARQGKRKGTSHRRNKHVNYKCKNVVHDVSGRTVLSAGSMKEVLRFKGVIEDLHFKTQLGLFDLVDALSVCKVFTVSQWVHKRLSRTRWWQTLDHSIKNRVLWRDLRGRVFWKSEKKELVRQLFLNGMRLADICGFIYVQYRHKIRVKSLIKRMWLWGFIKLGKPPPLLSFL